MFTKRKYPRWHFAGTSGVLAWSARASAYGLLLTDKFPSYDADTSPVLLEYDAPPNGQLSRWRVFIWKSILLIPHWFVLMFLYLALEVVKIIAWWAILATGRYPRGLFGFATGVQRWQYRLPGYAASFNDRFPPYSLAADAGPASKAGTIVSGVFGFIIAGGIGGAFVAAAFAGTDRTTIQVDYEALKRGRNVDQVSFFTGPRAKPTIVVTLSRVLDPETQVGKALGLGADQRVIEFEMAYFNRSGGDLTIRPTDVRLRLPGVSGASDAALMLVDSAPAPAGIHQTGTETTKLRVYFILPKDAVPSAIDVARIWEDEAARGPGLRFQFR